MSAAWIKRWKQEDIIGLDINDGHIVAAHFLLKKTGPVLNRLAVGKYDPTQPDQKIAQTIRDLWKKENFPTRTVCTCLHSRSLMVRGFHYKNVDLDELPQTLALKAEEALQSPLNEISMDWQLNSSKSNEVSTELSGTLMAAPRKTVARHLKLIQKAGLYSIHVETSCTALNNLYSLLTENQMPHPVCLINLTNRTADIIMRSNGGNYPRTLFSAGKPWDENMEYLLENIKDALLYYHLKLKHHPVQKLYLTGKIPKPDELQRELSKESTLPVEILDIRSDSRLICKKNLFDRKKHPPCNLETGIGLGLKRNPHELD